MSEELKTQDSFTIGTAATGGSFKIYLDILNSEESVRKIDAAISLWKKARMITLEELKR